MAFEKINYICVGSNYVVGQEKRKLEFQEKLENVISKLMAELESRQGWLKIKSENKIYYYNRSVRGLFPDFSNAEYTKPLLKIKEVPDMNGIFTTLKLAGMKASLITKKELSLIFPSCSKAEQLAAYWGWNKELLHQYFAVIPCEMGSEVCRIDEMKAAFWGKNVMEKACIIQVAHLANYSLEGNWQDDILFLMNKNLIPVLEDKKGQEELLFLADYVEFLQKEKDGVRLEWERLKQSKKAEKLFEESTFSKIVKLEKEQIEELKETLYKCDYERASLKRYDKSILFPPNGHWDLWKYVQYNNTPEDKLPAGKLWANVSKEMIYARNAADDIAFTAETVAIDFGTKSTTVAQVDSENHIVTVLIGEYASTGEFGESAYENPTILKFIHYKNFIDSYNSAEGRPETKFTDLSASYIAEKSFRERILAKEGTDVYSYHYQMKQWAYDNAFEPLIFDKERQRIKIKPYREIKEEDFDPIEIYAYLVGLNVVNMRSKKICTRYLLSYPPSYSKETCEKIRKSFEKGIKKAIPVEAQKTTLFQKNFSVQLWQSEPAAYAVCAIKEFGIVKKYGAAPVFCGVYDLGGGTVDYHFGLFSGGVPPYRYEGLQNGGNARLGCENILEELAYKIYSENKESLFSKGIRYEYPHLYPENLQDLRYTSNSRQAKLNTLGMIDGLRDLWIKNFKEKEDRLCYFEVYSESEEQKKYYIRMTAGSNQQNSNKSQAKKEGKNVTEEVSDKNQAKKEGKNITEEVTVSVNLEELREFFRERLEKTIREFFGMMAQTICRMSDTNIKCVIFLAGNGSRSPLVEEIFHQCMEENEYWQSNCELYAPLFTEEAKQQGQKTEHRKGSIPTAKTGVAHGLLISRPGSDFIRILESQPKFVFKYHLGVSRYDPEMEESVFCSVRKPDSFKQRDKKEENLAEEDRIPFEILEDGYLQFWYTNSSVIFENTSIGECNARQFLMKVPDDRISEKPYENRRGECYCRAVSETVLELLIKPIDREELCYYGILNLEDGRFEEYNLEDSNEKEKKEWSGKRV